MTFEGGMLSRATISKEKVLSIFNAAGDMWNAPVSAVKQEGIEAAILDLCEANDIDYGSYDSLIKVAKEAIGAHYNIKQVEEPPIELTEDLTRECTHEEIADILSSTIKKDDPAKLITFSNYLLAQTENDMFNEGFQSESSAGKSYIPMEVATYFPPDEILDLAGASPKAFFHKRGIYNKEAGTITVDVENKIMIFLDQPHYLLLETLRPLLSHDKKELRYDIVDKTKSGGQRTKTVLVRGFAAVAFSTTKMNPDEQEKTRMIMLSPSVDHDKLEESLRLLTLKKGDPEEYNKQITQDPRRLFLMQRIKAIRQVGVKEVIVPNSEEAIFKRFIEKHKHLIARHQRDYPRIFSLIKAHALLNCFNREKKNGHAIIANQTDIDAGFRLYEMIEDSNELGLSPHIYKIYNEVIKPLLGELGVERKAIQRQYYQVYHKVLSPETFRQEILPQLESAGFVTQEPDPDDKRRMLLYPSFYENNIVGRSGGTFSTTTLLVNGVPPNTPTISSEEKTRDNLFKVVMTELGVTKHDDVSQDLIVQELVKTGKFTPESAVNTLWSKRDEGKMCQPRSGYWRYV